VANSSALEIYLIRHGETEWSLSGQHTGITDLPLTPRGEQRAAALHPRLSQIHFDAVFSSPMQRARLTAELAGFGSPRITPLLQEVDYGEYEGLTRAQIKTKNANWELFRDGCPGGETPEQIYARAQAFIELASAQGGRILAFGHGHFLRAIGVAWIDAAIVLAGRLYLDVATLSALRHDDRGRVIAVWNAG
jgi:probable phosphoglycerate mutase